MLAKLSNENEGKLPQFREVMGA